MILCHRKIGGETQKGGKVHPLLEKQGGAAASGSGAYDVVVTGPNDCVDLKRHVKVYIQHPPKRTHRVNRRDGHVTKLNDVPTVLAQVAWGKDANTICFGVIQLEMVSQEPGSHFVEAGDEYEASCIKISWQGWVVGVAGSVICVLFCDTSRRAVWRWLEEAACRLRRAQAQVQSLVGPHTSWGTSREQWTVTSDGTLSEMKGLLQTQSAAHSALNEIHVARKFLRVGLATVWKHNLRASFTHVY